MQTLHIQHIVDLNLNWIFECNILKPEANKNTTQKHFSEGSNVVNGIGPGI